MRVELTRIGGEVGEVGVVIGDRTQRFEAVVFFRRESERDAARFAFAASPSGSSVVGSFLRPMGARCSVLDASSRAGAAARLSVATRPKK